jgi:amino acid transporter
MPDGPDAGDATEARQEHTTTAGLETPAPAGVVQAGDGAGADPKLMTPRGAVFLGVGSMVGAGIFALLGEAGGVAGSAVWVSFLVAGVVSGLLGYALVKLGVRYPSSGGLITYLIQAFGNGRVVGITSWLGYFTAIVLVGAMVAVSFGDYAALLVAGHNADPVLSKLFAAVMVIGATLLVARGASGVDKVQSVIVVALLAVFSIFIIATFKDMNTHLLAVSGYPSVRAIVSSVALTFFAYLGFAVISFAAGDIPNPTRNLPRAMYLALGITGALYVAIAIGVFGTLSVAKVIDYGPTAIAEAARPTLGDAGFTVMAVAALLATSSSVTATLYASRGLTGELAAKGQFPPIFGPDSRLGPYGGVWITALATVALAIGFDLGVIASVGSAVSLSVFALVAVAAIRLRREIRAATWILLLAVVSCGLVLLSYAVDTLWGHPETFWCTVATVVLAIVIDTVWKHRHPSGPSEVAVPTVLRAPRGEGRPA